MKKIAIGLLILLLCAAQGACAEDFIVRNGDRASNRIAVTIDDCYRIEHVREALALSERYDVPFTFFVLGVVVKPEDAELWRAVAQSACEIGNHTYGHMSLTDLDNRQIYNQLAHAQEALDAALGYHYPMQIMRPPFGNLNREGRRHVHKAIRDAGYDHAILWDIDTTAPDECLERVQNGSILLFHANEADIHCIETILPRLIEAGYELVTVSELIGKPPVVPGGEPYTRINYYDWLEMQR